jgi:hypothetical protein
LYGFNDTGEAGSAERATSGMGHLANDLCAKTGGDLLDGLYHGRLPPFLACRSPRRRGLFQRKADLQVIVVNDQPDGSLPRLASHAVQKFTHRFRAVVGQALA